MIQLSYIGAFDRYDQTARERRLQNPDLSPGAEMARQARRAASDARRRESAERRKAGEAAALIAQSQQSFSGAIDLSRERATRERAITARRKASPEYAAQVREEAAFRARREAERREIRKRKDNERRQARRIADEARYREIAQRKAEADRVKREAAAARREAALLRDRQKATPSPPPIPRPPVFTTSRPGRPYVTPWSRRFRRGIGELPVFTF